MFAKEFKTVLLGSMPAEHLKECASSRDQSTPKQGKLRSEKMSLKGSVLSSVCSSIHKALNSAQPAEPLRGSSQMLQVQVKLLGVVITFSGVGHHHWITHGNQQTNELA